MARFYGYQILEGSLRLEEIPTMFRAKTIKWLDTEYPTWRSVYDGD